MNTAITSIKSPVKRYVLLILLFLVTGYALYTSFIRGSANVWYYKAEFVLNDWADVGSIKDEQEYLKTLADITKAQSLDAKHPHYAHMLGRIKHWGVNNDYEPIESLVEVKSWYLKATQLRPLWPDPWVDLSSLSNYLDGYNDETIGYMNKALETGPYIALVTSGVLRVLLYNWDILSNEDKALVFENISGALHAS